MVVVIVVVLVVVVVIVVLVVVIVVVVVFVLVVVVGYRTGERYPNPDPAREGVTTIAEPYPPRVKDNLIPTPLGKVSQPSQNPTLHG